MRAKTSGLLSISHGQGPSIDSKEQNILKILTDLENANLTLVNRNSPPLQLPGLAIKFLSHDELVTAWRASNAK
jgi:hypothetical protein